MRRNAVIVLTTILVVTGVAGRGWSAYQPAASARTIVNFNPAWKFVRQDVSGAQNPDFNDRAWADIGLPHTYNDQDTFNQPPNPGRGDGGWGGKTWYRRHFTVDPSWSGKQLILEIEAARTVADVYLNGKRLGQYASGFSTFAFDITESLRLNSDNVLAIMVDDTEGENLVAGNNSHWQPVLGGLYRNVRLHVLDKLHVTLPYYSFLQTEGTFVGTPVVSAAQADFRITTEIKNDYNTPSACGLKTEVVDKTGSVVLTLTEEKSIPAHGSFKFDQKSVIRNPHLWSLKDPYLYTVYSTVSKDGAVTDVSTTPLGVRTITLDNNQRRFLLNGEPIAFHGWGQKPENSWPGLGSALPDWLLVNDMKIMKDAGGNVVRWGHCAGPVPSLEFGDREGFLNWQPNISGESDYKDAVWDNKMAVLRDILIRDRNHPSIVLWEGNNRDVSAEHMQQMRDIVHKWDWMAPRPFANRGPYKPDTAKLQDFSMDENNRHFLDGLACVEAEWYRPESPRRCWDKDSFPFVDFTPKGRDNYWRTQQDAMAEFTRSWKGIMERGGGVKWHLTDDTTHCRLEQYAMARLSGTMDATRLPKDMHFAMQCLFRDDPQVHIMGHWNYGEAPKPAKTHTVDVYSNCESVELFVNDKSLGTKHVENWRATWPDVPFEPGKVRAVAKRGTVIATDEHATAGQPVKVVLDVMTNPEGMKADRSDVAIVTAKLVDAKGVVHPLAHAPITFAVEGPAIYKGGYNDNVRDTVGKPTLLAEAGMIRVALRATNQAGMIRIRATSPGLQPAEAQLESHEAK